MKRVDKPDRGRDVARSGRGKGVDLDAVALEVLVFLAADETDLGAFLAVTGISPAAIRTAAADPAFRRGILSYLASDEALLVRFAGESGRDPEALGAAIEAGDPARWTAVP